MNDRIFTLGDYASFSADNPLVIEVTKTDTSSIAVWAVQPGQVIDAHFHPEGQDTWVVLEGTLTYLLGNGDRQSLTKGQVAIASTGQIHGAINEGTENAIFVSIYSAPEIGYVKASG